MSLPKLETMIGPEEAPLPTTARFAAMVLVKPYARRPRLNAMVLVVVIMLVVFMVLPFLLLV
jgi:hypothetical protein